MSQPSVYRYHVWWKSDLYTEMWMRHSQSRSRVFNTVISNVQYIYCVCMAILYICFEIYIYVMSAVVYLLRVPFEVYVERFGIDQ